ncbi:MAG TPA: protein phosphatase 2C domain-containing protein [Vicinamibacterales bacterium]|nr:protein phosphatase 2C domain-containing protein [Vicinamibacterales bacterium]
MELTVGSRTDVGPRKMNQDHFGWWPDLGLFVVADGMGGHNGGEVASHLAVEAIHGFIKDSAGAPDITWPFGLEIRNSIDANRLTTAVRLANRKIYNEGSKTPELNGMGTTVVAALVTTERITLVSIGDSRIYRLRSGELEQLTRDDTWLASVLGEKNADEADPNHPLRHVLTNVVGTKDDVKPESREEDLQPGDRYVFCTDGVHGRLDSASLATVLASSHSAEDGAANLVNEALKRGTTDNATALVINVT